MAQTSSVEKAQKADISSIAAFLEHASLIHRHLDWRSTLEWLGLQPFLLWMEQGEIQAILIAVPDLPEVAWLHCFGVKASSRVEEAWNKLYSEARTDLEKLGTSLFTIGLEDWFNEFLVRQGFMSTQSVVVLEWNHHIKPIPTLASELQIRPMIASDLDEVALVDERSFEKQWRNNRESIELSYNQSQHSTVVEFQNQIVGYELTTANQYAAHLARLAVLPEFQQRGIARYLVTSMLRWCANAGAVQVTVNTQSDNIASLHLYHELGFELTGETYPVYSL